MDFGRITAVLHNQYPIRLQTIDSHTAGEATRLILGGVEPLPGTTMADKRHYFIENLDTLRLLLTREPRGHPGILAALVTEPVSTGAEFGLLYMDARRYPFLCGHATIGAVSTMIETGMIRTADSEIVVVVDTPSGPLKTRATVIDGRVEMVAIRTVPSFVYRTNENLELPGRGRITVDTVCVGGFFVMVSADQIGLELTPANGPQWVALGMAIIDAANQQLVVRHPIRPEVNTVDVCEFYEPAEHAKGRGKSIVVYGEAHMDRSPCGTGTAAKLTLLHHRELVTVNQPFLNAGPLGTTFEARIVTETAVADHSAVVVEIRGCAQITGMHEFIIDPRDPFPAGFKI